MSKTWRAVNHILSETLKTVPTAHPLDWVSKTKKSLNRIESDEQRGLIELEKNITLKIDVVLMGNFKKPILGQFLWPTENLHNGVTFNDNVFIPINAGQFRLCCEIIFRAHFFIKCLKIQLIDCKVALATVPLLSCSATINPIS